MFRVTYNCFMRRVRYMYIIGLTLKSKEVEVKEVVVVVILFPTEYKQ